MKDDESNDMKKEIENDIKDQVEEPNNKNLSLSCDDVSLSALTISIEPVGKLKLSIFSYLNQNQGTSLVIFYIYKRFSS